METEATKFRKLVRWPYQGQLWVHLKKKKKKKKKHFYSRLCWHGTGLNSRIYMFRSYGTILTVRKLRHLTVQSSVWTERKYWTVPGEKSVLSSGAVWLAQKN